MDVPFWLWIVFGVTVVGALAVDLLAHRKAHVIGFKEAAWWSAAWVGLSLAFAGLVWWSVGSTAAVEFTTAWLLEKSLSVDNLFVFALIFGYFKVPAQYQHRVLFFGVIGALVFRGIFLALGVAVVEQFTAILFVFAAILLYSAWKLHQGRRRRVRPRPAASPSGCCRRSCPCATSTTARSSSCRRPASASPPRCSRSSSPSRRPTWSSPWTACPRSSRSATTRSSSTPATPSPSSACARCTSCSPGCSTASTTCRKGLALILAFIGVKLVLQASHKTIDTSIPEIPSLVSLGVIVTVLAASIVLSLRKPAPEPDAVKAAEHEKTLG